jgi:hypothetical protein
MRMPENRREPMSGHAKDDEIVRQHENAGFPMPRAVRFQFFAGILPVCFSRGQCTQQFQNLAGKFSASGWNRQQRRVVEHKGVLRIIADLPSELL